MQIRALMKARGWTQKELAEKAKMRQPTISALMSPGKTRPNIETLRRLAAAFDCAVQIRFVGFSELAKWSAEFDPNSFDAASFEQDKGFDDPLFQGSGLAVASGGVASAIQMTASLVLRTALCKRCSRRTLQPALPAGQHPQA